MTKPRPEIQFANLTLDSEAGTAKPMAVEDLLVPETIELWEDTLAWQPGTRAVTPDSKLLVEFVSLADAIPHAMLKFAKRWGVLELCIHHDRPASECGCAIADVHGWKLDPISGWRLYPKIARSMLNAADRLSQRESVEESDWEVIGKLGEIGGAPLWSQRRLGRHHAWFRLEVALNVWLSFGGVCVVVHHKNGAWRIGFSGRPAIGNWLFGAIGVQLVLAVANIDGFAFCSGCGNVYTPLRRPNQNRRRYCDTCKRGKIPERDAARAYRARKSCS